MSSVGASCAGDIGRGKRQWLKVVDQEEKKEKEERKKKRKGRRERKSTNEFKNIISKFIMRCEIVKRSENLILFRVNNLNTIRSNKNVSFFNKFKKLGIDNFIT